MVCGFTVLGLNAWISLSLGPVSASLQIQSDAKDEVLVQRIAKTRRGWILCSEPISHVHRSLPGLSGFKGLSLPGSKIEHLAAPHRGRTALQSLYSPPPNLNPPLQQSMLQFWYIISGGSFHIRGRRLGPWRVSMFRLAGEYGFRAWSFREQSCGLVQKDEV